MSRRVLLVALLFVAGRIVAHAQDCIPAPQSEKTFQAPVRGVSFSGRDLLLDRNTQSAIAEIALHRIISPNSVEQQMSNLEEEIGERTRIALQNEGYFKAEVESKAVKVGENPGQYHIEVLIRSPYGQYKLGDLRFTGAVYFPTQQLRDLFPIQQGEVFSGDKINHGLDALRRLYNSQGFVNSTPVPNVEFYDNAGVANLTVSVDEGKQFRVRSLDVLGTDLETRALLLDALALRPGDIYDSTAWERVLKDFPNAAKDPHPGMIKTTLDERNALIDVVLDLRPRPTCRGVASTGAPTLVDPRNL